MLSPADRNLDTLRRWAALLDTAFRVPGTGIRFGLDPILGLIPGIGDLATPVLSVLLLVHAARVRVPKVVLARMVINAIVDFAVGAIPVVGDLFDFGWKSNAWNLALLERHARPGVPPTRGDWIFVIACVAIVVLAALVPLIVVAWLLRHVSLF
ncbi:MAG: DUF4112 domain-containing protein [Acidobacteria bacterium]|nr:DUF4112 domain-containing protein [Acidobacteriota bacterium]